MSERTPARPTCTAHCTSCDHHFHGLAAFDAHRVDFECQEPAERRSEKGRELLRIWTETGICTLSSGLWSDGRLIHTVEGITIWQENPAKLESDALSSTL